MSAGDGLWPPRESSAYDVADQSALPAAGNLSCRPPSRALPCLPLATPWRVSIAEAGLASPPYSLRACSASVRRERTRRVSEK
jgi:hypothetical protein